MRLEGVKALTAGTPAAILGLGQRFLTDADLALHADIAPLEVPSVGRWRHRPTEGTSSSTPSSAASR